METEQLKELARQLSCPEGENGLKTAEQMNFSNGGMTRFTIRTLNPQPGETVLEIGPGNGEHVHELSDVQYQGADISGLMVAEARRINHARVAAGTAAFDLVPADCLPYPDHSFDRIFTVNTLYFWQQPEAYANEIYRVLRPGGTFCLAFALRSFMEKLPFVTYGFRLYDEQAALAVLGSFSRKEVVFQTEEIVGNTGQSVIRDYAVIVAHK